MCLAIPAKVLSKKGTTARVESGDGKVKEVNISMVDVNVDEYVLVYAGLAIESMDEKTAKTKLDLWREILAKSDETA